MTTGESGINLCDTCWNLDCKFQTGIVRVQCDFYEKRTMGLTKEELHELLESGEPRTEYGWDKAIDAVLEIIDKIEHDKKIGCVIMDGSVLCNTRYIKDKVLALKGEQV